MAENPFEMPLFGDSFDQSLTARGLEVCEGLREHVLSTIYTIENAPLPNRPLDDLGILHGDHMDHDKGAMVNAMRSLLGKMSIAISDTDRRIGRGGMLGGRGKPRASCGRARPIETNVSYQSRRTATRIEADALMQLSELLDSEDVVKHVRNCSSYFNAACEQYQTMVRRFLG